MPKTLIYQGLITGLIILFFLSKNAISPVFQLTNSPNILTKGHYGEALVVEISYSHDGLEEWLQQLTKPYPLILADAHWLARSEPLTKLLIEKQIPIGLLGQKNEMYEDSQLLDQELAVFYDIFQQMPLWFATYDDLVDNALLEQLFHKKINVLSPTNLYPATPNKGEFIAIHVHRQTPIDFQEVTNYMKSHTFLSIEESLFGYELSTKRYP
ncbi:MAG: hypothetical protein ABS949_19390 [Solibacillus sp.]